MKTLLHILSFLILCYSCTSKDKNVETVIENDKITFIGDFDDTDYEVVIKQKIRTSATEKEYHIIRHNDTLSFETSGRAFFMGGIMASILDTLILDKGDVVHMMVRNDSLQIVPEKSDVSANISWYNDYFEKVEDSYEEVLSPIKEKTPYSDEYVEPILFMNKFETEEVSMNYIYRYKINDEAYQQNRAKYDKNMSDTYFALDSMINNADIDDGSKQILHYALFTSTVNPFRRMKTFLQPWMYDKIKTDINQDCSDQIVDVTEYYLQSRIGKSPNKTTYLDLDKEFRDSTSMSCPDFDKELKRLCLIKMLSTGNNVKNTEELLESYIADSKDVQLEKFVENKFKFDDDEFNMEGKASMFYDNNSRAYSFIDILNENKGNVVLIDFWASWCVPCRKSMPDVKKLEDQFKDKAFKVIYASIDKHQSQWKKASIKEGLIARNNYIIGNFHESEIYKEFNITHVPRYIIYDKSGKAVYPHAPKPELMGEIIDDLLE